MRFSFPIVVFTSLFALTGCSQDSLEEVIYPDCQIANPCLVGDYLETTLECFYLPVDDGTACPLPNACVLGATCQAGECTSQEFVSCEDDNPCTEDVCNEDDGQCSNPNLIEGTVCPSTNACFLEATCNAGQCTDGAPVDCDDSNPCTVETCLEDSGDCNYDNVADGTPCGQDFICQAGICIMIDFPPTAPTVEIVPENPMDADDVTCTIVNPSVDVNGDAITYEYKWLIDGIVAPEYTQADLATDITNACESFTCVVTPHRKWC